MRLLENAVQIDPITEGQIVKRVRGRKPMPNRVKPIP
jgi:hypothetical protein